MRVWRKNKAALSTGITLAVTALVVVGGVYFFRDSIHLYMQRVLESMERMPVWGPISFIGLQILIVVFVIPGVLFTLGAGFLFGPVAGTAYVLIGLAALLTKRAQASLGERGGYASAEGTGHS
jgi:uncharacterized membrane protein YdjX (TVP38/TMEM64 family)